MSTTAPNVHPLVRVGTAANFRLYNGQWHRTEHYPAKCTCEIDPMQSVSVKPSIDHEWKYAPDTTWGACISRQVKDEGEFFALTDFGVARIAIGMRIQFDAKAQELYEQGKSGEWYVEAIGRDIDGQPQAIAKIREKQTNVYTWAPFAWISEWTEVSAQKETEPMVDMTTKADPIKALIPLKPTDDEEITCFICHRPKCTHEFDSRVRVYGYRTSVGVHDECIRGIVGVEVK